jgi:hypothetical protein
VFPEGVDPATITADPDFKEFEDKMFYKTQPAESQTIIPSMDRKGYVSRYAF